MKNNNEFSVQLEKEISANVETVFSTWTNGEALKKWCSPLGYTLTEVTMEGKQGSSINCKAVNDKGENILEITGLYEEVKQNEQLIYSWNWHFLNSPFKDSSFKITVNFKSNADNTILELKQENLQDEESIQIHQKGWEKALFNLENYLANNSWDEK